MQASEKLRAKLQALSKDLEDEEWAILQMVFQLAEGAMSTQELVMATMQMQETQMSFNLQYLQLQVGLTPDGGHLTGGTAGPAGRLSVCRASVGSTPRSFGSRLPAW